MSPNVLPDADRQTMFDRQINSQNFRPVQFDNPKIKEKVSVHGFFIPQLIRDV